MAFRISYIAVEAYRGFPRNLLLALGVTASAVASLLALRKYVRI